MRSAWRVSEGDGRKVRCFKMSKQTFNEGLSGLFVDGRCDEKLAVWLRTARLSGQVPAERLLSPAGSGSSMTYSAYGDRSRPDGWEKDHWHQTALGGPDVPANKIALPWRENVADGAQVKSLLAKLDNSRGLFGCAPAAPGGLFGLITQSRNCTAA